MNYSVPNGSCPKPILKSSSTIRPRPKTPRLPSSPPARSRYSSVSCCSRWLPRSATTIGRTGASWDSTGPEPGYFPFYLSIILGGSSLYGLIVALVAHRKAAETFVTRAQARRVTAVFVPTLLFCLTTQFLGLYVASFLLIAGFMRLVGKIALWKSLLTAVVFTAIMFVTFDIAFDVIMPKGPLEAAFGY
ncbi:hypothetical protein ACVWWK_004068 [Bradyrhizobium sp. LB9.1b]